ncbi:hypothetical protein B0H10DRAFT_1955570 [Mycena sp. CBHHK59/15]|nr:hypothetical protein B0H10DRAFT_1955570 [Mycena sp. CBHHK59/15]
MHIDGTKVAHVPQCAAFDLNVPPLQMCTFQARYIAPNARHIGLKPGTFAVNVPSVQMLGTLIGKSGSTKLLRHIHSKGGTFRRMHGTLAPSPAHQPGKCRACEQRFDESARSSQVFVLSGFTVVLSKANIIEDYKTRCTTQKNYMDLCMLKQHTPTCTRQIEAHHRRGGNTGRGILTMGLLNLQYHTSRAHCNAPSANSPLPDSRSLRASHRWQRRQSGALVDIGLAGWWWNGSKRDCNHVTVLADLPPRLGRPKWEVPPLISCTVH